jgi:hypothetical protein
VVGSAGGSTQARALARLGVALAGVAVALVAMLGLAASGAQASELVARATKREAIQVNGKGVARVTYRVGGRSACVLYRGAVNATRNRPRGLRFQRDRSCGWKSGWARPKARFANACTAYRGPALPYLVAACTHRDGSHWTLQRWARMAKNYGGNPSTAPRELRVSHFTGQPAQLHTYPNWSWGGRFFHIAATFTYQGKPWYAVRFKTNGEVTDGIGRNVTIDSWDSDMGRGWRRVNAVLTHRPSGQLCFGFSPKELPGGGRSGTGYSRANLYRLAVPGPGVSPDVQHVFNGYRLQDYSPAADDQVDALINGLVGGWSGRHNCSRVN